MIVLSKKYSLFQRTIHMRENGAPIGLKPGVPLVLPLGVRNPDFIRGQETAVFERRDKLGVIGSIACALLNILGKNIIRFKS